MTAVLTSENQGKNHCHQKNHSYGYYQQVTAHNRVPLWVSLNTNAVNESLTDMNQPFIWAHRGDSSHAPENTMSAFSAAVESGADGIEMDVHLSKDGIPVVIHDDLLERTTDGKGAVSDVTLRQLRQLDAGSWFSHKFAGEGLPALEDVLNVFGGQLLLNLELKDYAAGVEVLTLLGRYPGVDFLLSSFDYGLLKRLRAIDEKLPLAVLFDEGNWRRAVRFADEISASAFHPVVSRVNRRMVAACRSLGMAVSVWTVDLPWQGRNLMRMGVSGLFTNDPETLLSAFPELVSVAQSTLVLPKGLR